MAAQTRSSGDRLIDALVTGSSWIGYAFLIFPTLIIVPMSFGGPGELMFPPARLSTFLYERYFDSNAWINATLLSVKIALGTMVIATVFGLGAAYGLSRLEFRGKHPISMALLSPMFVPSIVMGLALYLFLAKLGLAGTAIGLIMAHTLIAMPFAIITITAGLKLMDPRLEVAAAVMGAGRLAVLRRVTVPLILPSVVASALFAFLVSFDEVVISYFIASARDPTLPVRMYSSIQWEVSPVLAAVSVILIAVSSAVCLATAFLVKEP
jgi:putative spermidine/putrescine transport system permease protein